MAKKKKSLKNKKAPRFSLPEETKKYILGIVMFLLAVIVVLSFFNQAGVAGRTFFKILDFFIGKVVFLLPLILILGGLVFINTRYEKLRESFWPVVLAIFFLILGMAGVLEGLKPGLNFGGYLGYLAKPSLRFFGFWVTQIIFGGIILIGALILWHLWGGIKRKEAKEAKEAKAEPSLIKKIFAPKFKVKEISTSPKIEFPAQTVPPRPEKTKEIPAKSLITEYQPPPLDLLDSERGTPAAGDIRVNSAIIKKTLENFSIPVEMSEINIGPTVTQYALKPAEGIKLSKITGLSNDLALALANHPIRIEAPLPGKSLVGIEVPNKVRAQVRLKDLFSNSQFKDSSSSLNLALGRDVAGNQLYADLAKMPHLLVAGSTGTGKTIFLNSLILSLLYRNSPATLRFILIDPKRVEFPVYNELPHLLCPVIFDAPKTINALKWLISEMERRFGVLSREKTRDIASFNETALRNGGGLLPYLVVIIDELADLMASRGREVEAAIVRLAQMARAVGIHLVVATQRPSVEVITGLIKANITARVTFQVASQVDSRTVLDMAGAEKLLGSGDMLFLSAEIVKPKRIQGPYVSEKEVRKVVNWLKSKTEKEEFKISEDELKGDLAKSLEMTSEEFEGGPLLEDDPLFEEAKRTVIEARKASASLLQRRLRIGYARAARLIDMLEEKEIIGPGEGAKPREVFFKTEEDDWQQV